MRQGERRTADAVIKICPICSVGYEKVLYSNIRPKNTIYITHYYGGWKNLGRGKEKRVCPKCNIKLNKSLDH